MIIKNIKTLYLGSKEVSKMYLGGKLIYPLDTTPASRVFSTLDFSSSGKEAYSENGKTCYYVKNGDSFVFRIKYTEELANNPTVTIGGKSAEIVLQENLVIKNGEYVYQGTFTIDDDEEEMEEGELEIKITNVVDLAGNVTEDSIQTPTSNGRVAIYDRTAPDIEITTDGNANYYENEDTTYYNNDVTIAYTDNMNILTVSLIKDDEELDYSDTLSDEGKYVLTVTDRAGNSTTKAFVIDKTRPTLNYGNGNIVEIANIVATDDNFDYMTITNRRTGNMITTYNTTYTIDGDADNVRYTIKAYDKAGNMAGTSSNSQVDVYIDNQYPVISGIENGETYESADITITDGSLISVLVTKDSEEYDNQTFAANYTANDVTYSNSITEEGTYEVTATDRYGHISTVTFTISATETDTEAPVINNIIHGKWYTTDVTVDVTDANLNTIMLETIQVINGVETSLGSKSIENGTILTDENKYIVTATDEAGNKSSVAFGIDKTNPTITLNNTEYSETESEVICFNENVTVNITDNTLRTYSVTKDGTDLSWVEETTYSDEGTYIVTATDKAGNKTTVTFTIETAETSILSKTTTSYNLKRYQSDIIVTVTLEFNEAVTIDSDDWTATDNTNTIYSTDIYSYTDVGTTQTINVIDASENESTVTFTVGDENIGFSVSNFTYNPSSSAGGYAWNTGVDVEVTSATSLTIVDSTDTWITNSNSATINYTEASNDAKSITVYSDDETIQTEIIYYIANIISYTVTIEAIDDSDFVKVIVTFSKSNVGTNLPSGWVKDSDLDNTYYNDTSYTLDNSTQTVKFVASNNSSPLYVTFTLDSYTS